MTLGASKARFRWPIFTCWRIPALGVLCPRFERCGIGNRALARRGQQGDPSIATHVCGRRGCGTAVARRGQALDVTPRPRGEDQGDWDDHPSCQAAPAQHEMDEGAAGAAVAVAEWVDGLELRVGECRLGNRGQIVVVTERDKIGEQLGNELGWGRDEGG